MLIREKSILVQYLESKEICASWKKFFFSEGEKTLVSQDILASCKDYGKRNVKILKNCHITFGGSKKDLVTQVQIVTYFRMQSRMKSIANKRSRR